MQRLRKAKGLLALGLLLWALSAPMFSQQDREKPKQDQNQRDRMVTILTGCLNKDASGSYTITDSSGLKTTVTGDADLEKHSKNHKVDLAGTAKTDAAGKVVFEVMNLTHVSDSCSAR